jgi:hypothetical protein
MRLFRVFVITSLLVAAIPRPVAAGVAAKSLQGLFSSDECEVVPELLGAWTGNQVSYSVRKGQDQRYWMIDRDADSKTGNKLVFEICVAHVDGQLFYDATFQLLRSGDEPTLPPEFVVGSNIFAVNVVAGFWVPMHIIGRLEIEKNALHFRNVDDKWLQAALKSRSVSVTSAQDDSGEYFLTANGKELKALMAHLATNPKAFSNQQDLTRIPEETPNKTP